MSGSVALINCCIYCRIACARVKVLVDLGLVAWVEQEHFLGVLFWRQVQ